MADFRAETRLDRAETYAETRINSGAAEANFGNKGQEVRSGFSDALGALERAAGRLVA